MRRLVTVVSVAAALVWSAIVWGGYGLLAISSDFLASSAWQVGLPPDVASWAGILDGILDDYGTGTAAALWALGLLGILLVRMLVNMLIGAASPRTTETVLPPPRREPEARMPPAITPPPPPVVVAPSPPAAPSPTRWGRGAARQRRALLRGGGRPQARPV